MLPRGMRACMTLTRTRINVTRKRGIVKQHNVRCWWRAAGSIVVARDGRHRAADGVYDSAWRAA